MVDAKSFNTIDSLVIDSRKSFRKNLDESQIEIEQVYSLLLRLIESISKFHSPEEWKNSQHEIVLCVLIQALETITAIYYISESGYWDVSLTLKRNVVELFSVAIAIGYDYQCYIDWKNGRKNVNRFEKIMSRIKKSNYVPKEEKKLLQILKNYWYESSQSSSHNINVKSIRTITKSGVISFEPKKAMKSFQKKRLRTVRNMLIDLLFLICGIFEYDKTTEKRKHEFPEALEIIREANSFFNNRSWKTQKTA